MIQWILDIPILIRSPLGRKRLSYRFHHAMWPAMAVFAAILRRTLLRRVRIVVVVGSFGKSTTVRCATAVLGRSLHPQYDFNAFGSVARAVLRIRPGQRHAVIEVGIDNLGQMKKYARIIRPDITIVTSVGSEHHRSLGTLESTRNEKADMVRCLPPSGIAVLNGDDPNVLWMRGETEAKVITFGLGATNDVRASGLSFAAWPAGTDFTLHCDGETRPFRVRLIGRPNVCAALAAVAVGLSECVPLDEVQARLEALDPTPGRLQPVRLENGAVILRDDFKGSLETIHAALDVFGEVPAERRIVVLGQVSEPPGTQGDLYRELGERVAGVASRAIFLCEKRDSAATAGAVKGGMPRSAITRAGTDIYKAIDALRAELGPGDAVLIKGRDTQRLSRITFALQGRKVACGVGSCRLRSVSCEACPNLAGEAPPPDVPSPREREAARAEARGTRGDRK